jgi:leader peptidase (prepilin peptidase)/N-methyltransferase
LSDVSAQLAALLASVAMALPVALSSWSLPERWLDPAAKTRLSGPPGLLSLALPILCGLWAAAAVPSYGLPGMLVLGWTLVALSIVDVRTLLLPDCLTLPLIAAGVGHSAWFNSPPGSDAGSYLLEAVRSLAAGAAGFLFMALVARSFRQIRGIEGLGLGDAKLFAAAGAWLGLLALPSVMLIAAVSALVATVLIHRMLKRGEPLATMPLPFGPYLAGATWIVALYGPLTFT